MKWLRRLLSGSWSSARCTQRREIQSFLPRLLVGAPSGFIKAAWLRSRGSSITLTLPLCFVFCCVFVCLRLLVLMILISQCGGFHSSLNNSSKTVSRFVAATQRRHYFRCLLILRHLYQLEKKWDLCLVFSSTCRTEGSWKLIWVKFTKNNRNGWSVLVNRLLGTWLFKLFVLIFLHYIFFRETNLSVHS